MKTRCALSTLLLMASCLLYVIVPAYGLPTNEAEPNDTLVTAQNLTPFFSTGYNPQINNSTFFPWVSVTGTNNGTPDFYTFTVRGDNIIGIFGIDYGWNPLELFGPNGGSLGLTGGGPNLIDPTYTYNFPGPGDYTILVPPDEGEGSSPGGDYTLDIVLDPPPTTGPDDGQIPEPATLFLLGSGLVGVSRLRRKFKR